MPTYALDHAMQCYGHQTVCIDTTERRLDLTTTWWMYALVIGGIFLIMWAYYAFIDPLLGQTFGWYRFFSISLVSGVIGALAVLFDNRILRIIFLSLLPLLILLIPVMLYLNWFYGGVAHNLNNNGTLNLTTFLVAHIPAFLFAIILLIQRTPIRANELWIGAAFWGAEILLTYTIYPNYGTFFFLSFWPTMLLVEGTIGLGWIILFLIQRPKGLVSHSWQNAIF